MIQKNRPITKLLAIQGLMMQIALPQVMALEPIAVLAPNDVPTGFSNSFGSSVAISGDYIAVGAERDPYYNGDATGAVYVFRRLGSTWVQQAKLTAPDGTWEDKLGYSVAIDGDVVVAGTPKWIPWEPGASGPGAVYVYRRHDMGTPNDPWDDTWPLETKLTGQNTESAQIFGYAVAISGHLIVVGNPWTVEEVELYRWSGISWRYETTLTSPSLVSDVFGVDVDADGDQIIVGAYWNETGPGSAYIFHQEQGSWVNRAHLTPNDHTTPDSFGTSVSISEGQAVVGAYPIGRAYTYAQTGPTSWVENQILPITGPAPGAQFGKGVALDKDLVMATETGVTRALVFQYQNDTWQEVEHLMGPNSDVAPDAVALNGSFAAIGRSVYVIRDCHSLAEFSAFQRCIGGMSESVLPEECRCTDLNMDGHVDLVDFESFMGTFSGPL